MRGLGLPGFDPDTALWQPAILSDAEPPISPDVREDYLVDDLKH